MLDVRRSTLEPSSLDPRIAIIGWVLVRGRLFDVRSAAATFMRSSSSKSRVEELGRQGED
jgi:hypothetical protein